MKLVLTLRELLKLRVWWGRHITFERFGAHGLHGTYPVGPHGSLELKTAATTAIFTINCNTIIVLDVTQVRIIVIIFFFVTITNTGFAGYNHFPRRTIGVFTVAATFVIIISITQTIRFRKLKQKKKSKLEQFQVVKLKLQITKFSESAAALCP